MSVKSLSLSSELITKWTRFTFQRNTKIFRYFWQISSEKKVFSGGSTEYSRANMSQPVLLLRESSKSIFSRVMNSGSWYWLFELLMAVSSMLMSVCL